MKMGHLGAFLLTAATFGWAAEPTSPPVQAGNREESKYTLCSGADLVRLLNDEASRTRAFHELIRRNNPARLTDFEQFAEQHRSPEVVVCPQASGQPPIYLVLYGFHSGTSSGGLGQYEIERAEELFPNATPFRPWKGLDDPAIEAFDSEGLRLTPFGGNNVLNGMLADINADGVIERVEGTSYGIDGMKSVHVLEVSAVKPIEEPMFAVLLNWGADEWDFRLSPLSSEGVADIEVGPRTPNGLKPKVVFKWNKRKHTYTSLVSSAHAQVLGNAPIIPQLERLATKHLVFPKDAEASAAPGEQHSDNRAAAPPAKAYRNTSLAALSDSKLLHYMGRGKASYDFVSENMIRSRLPQDFWVLEAKAAALALIEANQVEAHRNAFLIALDDRDQAAPPPKCALAFSDSSARCYNAVDAHYFLRVDPQDSYLAYAREWSGGAVFFNLVHDQPAFDLRICPLPYAEAKKVADVIWWLDRVRSIPRRRGFGGSGAFSLGLSFSTADGHGGLTLRGDDGLPMLERRGTLWAAQLSERLRGEYDQEAFVNVASYLIAEALPQHLGRSWAQWEPTFRQDILARKESAPLYTAEELAHLKTTSARFLGLFTSDQEKISYAIVSVAAKAAGALPLPETLPQVRVIASALPSPVSPMRSYEEVSAEAAKTAEESLQSPQARKRLQQRSDDLAAEIDAIIADARAEGTGHLRRTADLSLRQIAAAHDPVQLLDWAISNAEGSQWALQRLATIDQPRYGTALECWIAKAEGKWARQLFEELSTVAPERAVKIAKELPSDRAGALALSAFAVLRTTDTIPEESTRLTSVIGILHDPKSGWQERGRAIELLAPPENPLRYPGPEVDNALLHLLNPDQADDNLNFTLGAACRALARRGKVEHFDQIAKTLATIKDSEVYSRVLGSLTQLAQFEPARLNPRLLSIIKPNLVQTNIRMTEILWSIWSADLRELKPELERVATASPEDYEDPKASSSGGKVTAVNGRFHLARKILSLWNEKDDTVRVRLLAGLALGESSSFIGESEPERLRRLQIELQQAGARLTAEQVGQIASLLHLIEQDPNQSVASAGTRSDVSKLVRSTLAK